MIDWKAVEVKVMDCQLPVELRIDEYDVTLIRTREKNSLYTVIFINGKINFKWCTEDCDIRKRKSKSGLPTHTTPRIGHLLAD